MLPKGAMLFSSLLTYLMLSLPLSLSEVESNNLEINSNVRSSKSERNVTDIRLSTQGASSVAVGTQQQINDSDDKSPLPAGSDHTANGMIELDKTTNARLAKTFSVVKSVQNGLDSVLQHKSDPYASSWSDGARTNSSGAGGAGGAGGGKEEKKINGSSTTSLTDAIRDMSNRRASVRNQLKQYTSPVNRYTRVHALGDNRPTTDRALIYPSLGGAAAAAAAAGGIDDFETQAQNYDTEYFPAPNHEYEENYNSLPDDQSGGGGYEDAIPMVKDPYRGVTNFMNHHQHQQEQANGFFGPPITSNPSSYYQDAPAGPPYYQDSSAGDGLLSYLPEQPGVVSLTSATPPGCHCPSRVTRQGCGSAFSEFLGLAGALGGNLWAMAQVIGTSVAPFVIPLLAVKLILVPLKILKFLNLVKIFLKVFIILPFFVRYVYPALYNYTASLPGLFMQQFHNIFPSSSQQQKPQHPLLQHHHRPHKPRPYEEIVDADDDDDDGGGVTEQLLLLDQEDPEEEEEEEEEDLESRGGSSTGNRTHDDDDDDDDLKLNLLVDDSSMWDLRACPSRVACELGAYLAGSTDSRSFPPHLSNYLADKADKAAASRAIKAPPSLSRTKNHHGSKLKEKKISNNSNNNNNTSSNISDHDYDDDDDDDEEDEMQRNAVYKAFILALVRKWPLDKCSLFNCPVLF